MYRLIPPFVTLFSYFPRKTERKKASLRAEPQAVPVKYYRCYIKKPTALTPDVKGGGYNGSIGFGYRKKEAASCLKLFSRRKF
ncbi:hypothetical protein HMPREF3293_02534 [Christensenella minuta]|uniref:Uncharacterized protein n=1 Tax=Christensenella minuta TaxID=626937 RepID=A0A136Q1B1_9FIRM|nr:hypothetical protein HMPREF3293_02534 [Christensenella minuta]